MQGETKNATWIFVVPNWQKKPSFKGRFYSFQDGFGGIFHFGSRQELHSTRVQHEDVETAVQQKGEAASWNHSWHGEFAHLQKGIPCVICVQELEILHRATDQNMERLGRRIEVGSHFCFGVVVEAVTSERDEDHMSEVHRLVTDMGRALPRNCRRL